MFFGRFLGPIRAVVPVIAGMTNMPASHFYVMNVLSAFGWAAIHLVPGALFGASLQVAGAVSARLVALIAFVAVTVWAIVFAVRFAVRFAWPYVRLLQDRILVHAKQQPGWLAKLVLPLVDPERRESMSLLIAATLLIGGAWLFLGVVEDVVTNDTLVQVDRSVYEGLQGVRTGWIDDIMVTLTALGSAYVTVAVIVAVAVWLGVVRRWQTLAYWIGAVAFAEVLVWALKYGLERKRPDTHFALVDPYSFPSGHAALSIVVYGFLAFLLGHGKSGWKKTAFALPAVAIAALIAFSRLYLGAHWFSDVMASLGLGLAWIGLLCIAYLHHVHEKPLRALPMSIVVFTVFVFFGTLYAHRYHERDLALYAKPANARTLMFAGWMSGEWRRVARGALGIPRRARGALFAAMGGNGGSGACRARERAMAGAGGVGIGCDAAVARSHDADRPVAGAAEVPPGPAAGADVRSRRRCSQSRRDPPVARRNRHQAG